MSVVLACDLGSTSFRAGLIDAAGVVLAECTVPAPKPQGGSGASEIDPAAWWVNLCATAQDLARIAPEAFRTICGIAICGVTRTQVLLGGDGTLLRPALSWQDTRAEAVAASLRAALGQHPEAGNVNAFHPLARLAWLREHEPLVIAALATVLEPKDYLNFRLTGHAAGDPVSLARLIASAQVVGEVDPLGCTGLGDMILPALHEPCDAIGPVQAGLPAPLDTLAGVPVFCAANDTWAAVVGLGAMAQGKAYNISGTTEVLGVLDRRSAAADGLLSVDWRGLHQLGGPSQNGADTVSWLISVLGRGESALASGTEILLAAPRDPQPLLFLPYLQGERVPYWDPSLRGAFIGLNRSHGATDLAYAVLEGIAFQNRLVLERAEAALGHEVAEIRFGGGGAKNARWCQIKADICGRPVVVGAAGEPGLLGAAIIAWTGLGQFASLQAAQDALVTVSARFEPDTVRSRAYHGLYRLYREGETALAPVSRGLAGYAGPLAGMRSDAPGLQQKPST